MRFFCVIYYQLQKNHFWVFFGFSLPEKFITKSSQIRPCPGLKLLSCCSTSPSPVLPLPGAWVGTRAGGSSLDGKNIKISQLQSPRSPSQALHSHYCCLCMRSKPKLQMGNHKTQKHKESEREERERREEGSGAKALTNLKTRFYLSLRKQSGRRWRWQMNWLIVSN